MPSIKELLDGFNPACVLDVATGRGGFIGTLSEELADIDAVVGIDINRESLNAARQAFSQGEVHFARMDSARLGFPDGCFDMASIVYSLHHLTDLQGILVEVMRALRPGGRLLVCEMVCDGQTETQFTHVYLHHWWAEVDRALGVTHNQTFTRQQVLEIVQGVGLCNLQLQDWADLEADPHEAGALETLNGAIDHYLQRATGLPNAAALQERGEELRRRLQTVGFHGATCLIAIGEKA